MTTRGTDARRPSRAIVGVLAALLIHGAMPGVGRGADPPPSVAARELARQQGGTPADFVVVYEAPTVAGGGWAGKLVDSRSGEVHAVHLLGDGSVTVGADAPGPAAPTRVAGGKADRALTVAMASAAPSKELPVAIWLDVDTEAAESAVRGRHAEVSWVAGRPMASTLAQARALRGELWESRRGAYAAAAEALRPAIEAAGGSIAYVSSSAPVVFVDLPSSGIAPLSSRPDVLSLGLEGGWETEMSSAGPTVRANWTSGSGDQGAGVRVGIVEYHNVHNTGDLAGQVVKSYSTTGRLAYGSGSDDHPTWVGGAVASRSGSYPGTAPGADLVSASTGGYHPSLSTDRAIIQAADWAVSPGGGDADVLNASIGQDTATGAEEARRYFDSIGWEDGRLVVSASGNFTTFGNWDVVSPATGYNVLAVGGITDRNTRSWGDDRIWYAPGSNGSSYRDRSDASWNTHGDYNKPNLSAPAVSVRTANGMIGDGTSVASPMVGGIAAQLIARAPTLATWPEGTRAILLAGARRHTTMSDGSVNADHEGVGTVDALWSSRILSGTSFGSYRIAAMAAGQVPSQEFRVIRGQRVRVALAWSSHTSGSSNTGKADTLASDLELRVIGPDGAVRWGATFDNPYETVDITAGTTGTMRVEIRSSRFGGSEEPYGLAWTIGGPFTDADDSPFRADILWALEAGVTAGCSATTYCPTSTVTREQMASFLVRALRLPPATRDYFTDDESSQHESAINAIAAAGITGGCSGTRYCPRSAVTREQMASFLVRALRLPASSRDFFTDDETSQHERSINALAAAGITGGCSATKFCPKSSVTRGQMAAFLHRAFD